MWFWSVFWPTNCPVNFSFFLVGQKKLSTLWLEGEQFKKKTGQKNEKLTRQLVGLEGDQFAKKTGQKNSREWTKKIVRALRLDNWLAKETDQNQWMSLICLPRQAYKMHYNQRLVYFKPTFWRPKTFTYLRDGMFETGV